MNKILLVIAGGGGGIHPLKKYAKYNIRFQIDVWKKQKSENNSPLQVKNIVTLSLLPTQHRFLTFL